MSNEPNNRPMNELQWADYLAQRKSGTTQGPSDQHAAEPQQVYDLEVDSSLRGLAQISNDTDPEKRLVSTVTENANQSFEPEAGHRPASRRIGFLVIASALAVAAISAFRSRLRSI